MVLPIHVLTFLINIYPANKSSNIGNRELLAINLALEEWHNLLKVARHSLLVKTGHKNLQNICISVRFLKNLKQY